MNRVPTQDLISEQRLSCVSSRFKQWISSLTMCTKTSKTHSGGYLIDTVFDLYIVLQLNINTLILSECVEIKDFENLLEQWSTLSSSNASM